MRTYFSAAVLVLVMASAARAQSIQPGIAGNIGSSGLGIEADIAFARFGIFGRAQAAPDSRASAIGARLYVLGERNSGFYVSGARARLRCSEVRLNGTGTGCTGSWHSAWLLTGGVEIGSEASPWSVYVDAGPYTGLDDAPGVREWTFLFGARFRIR